MRLQSMTSEWPPYTELDLNVTVYTAYGGGGFRQPKIGTDLALPLPHPVP
jgi:hypothetical protein